MALLPGVLKNVFSFRRDKNSDVFYFRVKTEKERFFDLSKGSTLSAHEFEEANIKWNS